MPLRRPPPHVAVLALLSLALPRPSWTQQPPPVETPGFGVELGEELGEGGRLGAEAVGSTRVIYQGRPIARVELRCSLPRCRDRVELARLVALTGLEQGQPFVEAAVERAYQRLAKTGFFESIDVDRSIEPEGGVAVVFDALGATTIRDIRFEGLSPPPFEADLRKILLYREGQPYVSDLQRERVQLESLETKFREEGYYGARIALVSKAVPDDEHQVDLVFTVEKGPRLELCQVGLRGLKAMSYEDARGLLESGLSVWARLGLVPERVTASVLEQGREALLERYREMGYFQARVTRVDERPRTEEGCFDVLFDVEEGPLWELTFEGEERINEDSLREVLPLTGTGYVDREALREAEAALRTLYETRGHPFALITVEPVRHDRLDRELRFSIEEGPELEISALGFAGNQAISDEELSEASVTRPFTLFAPGGYLQREALRSDMQTIEELYRRRGFLRAIVERVEVQPAADGDGLAVLFHIEEGPQTRVKRLEIEGNRNLFDATLTRTLEVTGGHPFSPLQLKADRTRIIQEYLTLGYPVARVETTCRRLTGEQVPCEVPRLAEGCREGESEVVCQRPGEALELVCGRPAPVAPLGQDACRWVEGVTDEAVIVEHRIQEGPKVWVGDIFLRGHFDTDRDLILQEIPLQTGDLFDTTRILEGQSNLRSLGIFDTVSIEAIGLEGVEGPQTQAALLVSLEESRSRFIDLKGGLQVQDFLTDDFRALLTLEGEYSDRNFMNRARRFTPRLIGAIDFIQLYDVLTSLPGRAQLESDVVLEVDYLAGAELIYSDPRFLKGWTSIDKLLLVVTPYYLRDLVGATNRQFLREELGLRAEGRKEFRPLDERPDRLLAVLGLEGKNISTWQTQTGPVRDGRRIFSPRRWVARLFTELTYDAQNSPLNPTSGFLVRLRPEWVTGAVGAQAIEDSFLRLQGQISVYLPLVPQVTLGQNLAAGQIVPLFGRQTLVPPEERFYLGGVQTVRGFVEDSIGRRTNATSQAGGEFMMNYNVELRYPLLRELDLWGTTFFDAGLVADCRVDGNTVSRQSCYGDAFPDGELLSKVRTSAGLGVRYLILEQIPLLVDYGVVLDRRPGENFGSLHLTVGYTF